MALQAMMTRTPVAPTTYADSGQRGLATDAPARAGSGSGEWEGPAEHGAAFPLPMLITSLGGDGLARELFGTLAAATGAAHMSIIDFDERLVPKVVAAESLGNLSIARQAGDVYQASLLYMHDPTRLSMIGGWRDANGPIIGKLHANEIDHRGYRHQIYDRYGLVERLSLLDHLAGHWYVLNLYRTGIDGCFRDADVGWLRRGAGVISALVGKQLQMIQPERCAAARSALDFEAMVTDAAAGGLTRRQIEVCARALMGMTNAAIALDLGIQASTVSTLRKRAYAALNISSLSDLFAKCLTRPRHY